MAWSDIGGLGNDANKASSTTFTSGAAALTAAIGDVCILFVGADNIVATTGTTNQVTNLTDTAGNTWTKIMERGKHDVTTGGVVGAAWISQLTAAISLTDTWTVTFSGATTAKAMGMRKFTLAAGKTYSVTGTPQFGTVTASTTTSSNTLNIGSAPATSRLWLAQCVFEGPTSDTYTKDADFTTTIAGVGNSAGTADTNVNQRVDRLISATDTTITHQASISPGRNSVSMLFALDEVNVGGGGTTDGFHIRGGGYYPRGNA